MPPLLADFIHARGCKPKCEKLLTLPLPAETVQSGLETLRSFLELVRGNTALLYEMT